MKKSVNGIKLRPHDNNTERIVATRSAHFNGPFTINSPKTNSISTKAPTYTLPFSGTVGFEKGGVKKPLCGNAAKQHLLFFAQSAASESAIVIASRFPYG